MTKGSGHFVAFWIEAAQVKELELSIGLRLV
jgi:hypothetical protein